MTTPRVLHVSSSDLWGGAARAAHRLHQALRRAGTASDMLVMDRRGDDPHVMQWEVPFRQLLARTGKRAARMITRAQRTPTNPTRHSLNLFPGGLPGWIDAQGYDVVNLHWLGDETISIEEIGRIRTPLCWTMHDMWAFSGAEHYDDLESPGRYSRGYARDTRPDGYRGPDLDAWVWRRKRRAWAGRKIQLISPSHWLAGCADQSALMRNQPCTVIPNCVGDHVFRPLDPGVARRHLKLDQCRLYVLFGAMWSTSDPRKGFHLLQRALRILAAMPDIAGKVELLVFGADPPTSPPHLGLPVRYLGTFNDDAALATLYNAADVFVLPSMQDNLPNTLFEALACGTPGVAFNVGGIPDLIQHRQNGWLAPPFDLDDFAAGIRHWLLEAAGRERRVLVPSQDFSDAAIAARYRKTYEALR